MILILLLSTFLAILIVRHYRKVRKLPPGPFTLPLIGNIPQIVYYSWKHKGIVPAFESFRKKYGNVFTLWLGPLPHVSIADYETNHEVFVKNGNRYKDRFLPPLFGEINENHGIVFANGDIWAELRKFTMVTFRNMGVGRDIMEEKIMKELNERCTDLDAKATNGNTVIEHGEFFELMVGSVINNLLVGKRFDDSNKAEFLHLRQLLESVNDVFTMFDLILPVWILKNFFPTRYRKLFDGQTAINDYVGRVAVERWRDVQAGDYVLDGENPNDFVDAFLIKMQKEKEHPAYSMKALKYLLSDLWSAGHDTTSTTLTSGFNQLVNHPEVQKKVRDELLKITDNGSRPLSVKDRADAHCLNATIAEIQRHASILNVNFWKLSDTRTMVNGYGLDSGEILTAQLSALHVNEDIFKDAGAFRPERFLENEKLLHQLIPFGIGKRSCVGENLARAELFLIFGNLILRYNVQPHTRLPSTEDQLPYSAVKIADKSVSLVFTKL